MWGMGLPAIRLDDFLPPREAISLPAQPATTDIVGWRRDLEEATARVRAAAAKLVEATEQFVCHVRSVEDVQLRVDTARHALADLSAAHQEHQDGFAAHRDHAKAFAKMARKRGGRAMSFPDFAKEAERGISAVHARTEDMRRVMSATSKAKAQMLDILREAEALCPPPPVMPAKPVEGADCAKLLADVMAKTKQSRAYLAR